MIFFSSDAFGAENYLANFLCVSLVLFGLCIGYIVTYGPFARTKSDIGDEHVPLT